MKNIHCRPLSKPEKKELDLFLSKNPTKKSAIVLSLYSREITVDTVLSEKELKKRIQDRLSEETSGKFDTAEEISDITIIKYLRQFNEQGLSCLSLRSNTKLTDEIKDAINKELQKGTDRKSIIALIKAQHHVNISNVDISRSIESPVTYPITQAQKDRLNPPYSLLAVMLLLETLKELTYCSRKNSPPSLEDITSSYLPKIRSLTNDKSDYGNNFDTMDEDRVQEMLDSLVDLLSTDNLLPENNSRCGRLAKAIYSGVSGHVVRYKMNDVSSVKPLLFYSFVKGHPLQDTDSRDRRPIEEKVLKSYIHDLYDKKRKYYHALEIEYIVDYEWEKPVSRAKEIDLTKNHLLPVIKRIVLRIPTRNYLVTLGSERYLVGSEVIKRSPDKSKLSAEPSQSPGLAYYQLSRILSASIGDRTEKLPTKEKRCEYRLWCTITGVALLQNAFGANCILAKKERKEDGKHLFLIRFSKSYPGPRLREIVQFCISYPNDIWPSKPSKPDEPDICKPVKNILEEGLKKIDNARSW